MLLLILLAPLACNFQVEIVQTPEVLDVTPLPLISPTSFQIPSPTEEFIIPTPYLDIPILTLPGLKNAEYLVDINGVEQTIRLVNGQYQTGTDSSVPGFVMVTLNEMAAFGDLNNDGIDDAVVLMNEWRGGTGISTFIVAVINWAGIPRHEASALLGDRVIISSLRIENGLIFVDTVMHGPNDPGCCPSQHVAHIFRLTDQNLVEDQ